MNLCDQNSAYLLLDTVRRDKENKQSFLFSNFNDIITFNYGQSVENLFRKIESYLKKGYWLAGYFNYEFGYFLEPALSSLAKPTREPLVWLGVCKRPKVINTQVKQLPVEKYQVENLRANISLSEYLGKIKKIKDYLAQGLTYQVNFTFKVKFDFSGNYWDCYSNLRRSQPTAYSALINDGKKQIISLSPELFFRYNQRKIVVRPMKGTSKRGLTLEADQALRQGLGKSSKIRAENIMIVDLLRNDLGRIAEDVSVSKLFAIEKYPTLYQMTSTISARLQKNLKLKELFSALFPCGSVTGAPKIKTMQIISKLEKEPRGIYTGAIGYISPQAESCFNVAIRTISLQNGRGEIGIGGGVVYDSVGRKEYDEALLKAKFFVKGFPELELIESLLLEEGKYPFLALHLKRLKKSSDYFQVPLKIKAIKAALEKAAAKDPGKFKLRLLVNLQGGFRIQRKIFKKVSGPVSIKLSSQAIDPNNSFLYHKTTKRKAYDRARKKANSEGFFEVVFFNIYRQLTEGTITNLFILKGNQLYTPPLKCGLLPGVLRASLISSGKVKEKVLYLEDLFSAKKVFIGNSLQGLIEAKIRVPAKLVKVIEKA